MKDKGKNEETYFVVPTADHDVTPEDIPGIEGMDDVTLFREAGVCDRAAGVALREARGCERNYLWWIRRLRKFQDVIDARKARTPEPPRRWRGWAK